MTNLDQIGLFADVMASKLFNVAKCSVNLLYRWLCGNVARSLEYLSNPYNAHVSGCCGTCWSYPTAGAVVEG